MGYFKHLTYLQWGCHTCIHNFFLFRFSMSMKSYECVLISIQNKIDFSRSKEVNYLNSDIKIKRGKLSRFWHKQREQNLLMETRAVDAFCLTCQQFEGTLFQSLHWKFSKMTKCSYIVKRLIVTIIIVFGRSKKWRKRVSSRVKRRYH